MYIYIYIYITIPTISVAIIGFHMLYLSPNIFKRPNFVGLCRPGLGAWEVLPDDGARSTATLYLLKPQHFQAGQLWAYTACLAETTSRHGLQNGLHGELSVQRRARGQVWYIVERSLEIKSPCDVLAKQKTIVCARKINDCLLVTHAGIKTEKTMWRAHGAAVGLCSPGLGAWEVLPDDGARSYPNFYLLKPQHFQAGRLWAHMAFLAETTSQHGFQSGLRG